MKSIYIIITALVITTFCAVPNAQINQRDKIDNVKQNIVYVTKTGSKYHSSSCHYLKYSKIQMSLSDAKSGGYTPCSYCKGGSSSGTTKNKSTYSSRCQATTQKGTQCKRNAESNRNYCWQH